MSELSTSALQTPTAVADQVEILALDELVARVGGHALSDQHRLAVTDDPPGRQIAVARDAGGVLIAIAQLVRGNANSSLEVLVAEDADPDVALAVAAEVMPLATTPVHWWWSAPSAETAERVRALGAVGERHLVQMRRSLPTGLPVTVETRDFRVGEDEAAWVEVNNRAFADHPEQGRWTVADVRRRQAEPWFDATGFRLHERAGRLAAFCWTKVHHDADPVLGEIYVIGVDPDFQGLGLGRQLTLAGLASLAERGIEHGMLYVDEGNAAALGLYEALGFTVDHVDVAFTFPPGRSP